MLHNLYHNLNPFSKDDECQPAQSDAKNNVAMLSQRSRSSATSSNGIQVDIRAGKEIGLKSKPNAQVVMETGSKSSKPSTVTGETLLDKDDTIKREAIMQSPLKGIKRLSSRVSCL